MTNENILNISSGTIQPVPQEKAQSLTKEKKDRHAIPGKNPRYMKQLMLAAGSPETRKSTWKDRIIKKIIEKEGHHNQRGMVWDLPDELL